MALLHHTLLFHAPSTFHIPKLRTTGSVGSGLPFPRTRAGRSLTEPATSFHKQGQRRREPAGNTAPCPCFVLSEGARGLTRAIAAAAAALLLCLGPGVTEAGADGGRRVPPSLPCADVAGYYSGVDGLEGVALMRRLGDIVSVHRSLAYKEVWDALKILDAADPNDPENSAEVMEIYSLRAVRKSLAGKREGWNREHLWPRSYGLIDKASLTDLHNLRPADVNVNSSRGNKYFGDCFSESNGCSRPANIEAAPDTETDNQRWAPPVQVRGDIARSLMYMAVCYGFQQPGGPHLQLSDSPNAKNREMGLLSALLEWNKLDPPSEAENLRNERICRVYQHNRNPFIDHPEYANLLWKQTTKRSKMYMVSSKAWINEFHYDNKGKDRNEVYPALNGDDKTRFFVSWTKDGSKTVCYNLKCPGFVHTSGLTPVDTNLQPVSEYGGRQYEITLEVAKDPRTSHWWVYLQGYSLGYWPKELVPAIAGGADVLAFGGEVTNVISSGPPTQMGSGHPASEGFRKASLLNRIRTSEDPDVYNPPEHNNLDVIIDCNCYNLQVGNRIDRLWGFFLFFGGPGENSKCTC